MERERNQQHTLLPETQALLATVERQTGRDVVIRADASVASRGRAIYVVSDPDVRRHLVLYDPSEWRHLDHLIGHEMGHALHFSEAAVEDRRVPVVTSQSRARALEQLLPEMDQIIARGLSPRAVTEVLPIWLSGTVAQLSDTPSDIRIERSLFEDHPGLRAAQRESLHAQARTLARVLRPQVERLTPRSLWVASNAMNYVLVESIARLFGEPGHVRPYLGTPAQRLGEDLRQLAAAHTDGTLAGDRRVSDAWAERMGFAGWFEWRRVDQLPRQTPLAVE